MAVIAGCELNQEELYTGLDRGNVEWCVWTLCGPWIKRSAGSSGEFDDVADLLAREV